MQTVRWTRPATGNKPVGGLALNVFGHPSVSKEAFALLLGRVSSPAAPEAQTLYPVLTGAGVDPLFAYGQFGAESSFGIRGHASVTKNWGNILWYSTYDRFDAVEYCPGNGWCYCRFPNWVKGVEAYVWLLSQYRERGLVTIEQVCGEWLGHDPTSYIATIENLAEAGLRRIDLASVVEYEATPQGAYVTIPAGFTTGYNIATLKPQVSKTLTSPLKATALGCATWYIDGLSDGKDYARISSGTFGGTYVAVSSYEPKPDPEQQLIENQKEYIETLRKRLATIAQIATED